VLLFLFYTTSIFAEKGYGFQVVNVAYPQFVRPNETFQISVTIHYWIGPYFRDKVQLQMRVYDHGNDATVLIENHAYDEYNVSGEDVYALTLTAPNYNTSWRLSVRAYLVASHYDLSHAETDWYKDIEIQVSETVIQTTTTTYSTIEQAASTSAETTYETTTGSTTVATSVTQTVIPFSLQNAYILAGIAAVAIGFLAIALVRIRRKNIAESAVTVKYCIQCGIRLEAGERFCNRCGAKQ